MPKSKDCEQGAEAKGRRGTEEPKKRETMKSLDELRIPGIRPRRMQEAVDGTSWRSEPKKEENGDSG